MGRTPRAAFIVVESTIQPRGVFQQHGKSSREFLSEWIDDTTEPREFAVKIFEYYCFDDGGFNKLLPGVSLAVRFLDEVLAGPEGKAKKQSLRDLKALLDTNQVSELRNWISANYQ